MTVALGESGLRPVEVAGASGEVCGSAGRKKRRGGMLCPTAGFFCTDNRIFAFASLIGPTGLAAYSFLRRCANEDGACWPSMALIGKSCGLHPKTARRAIAKLKAAGLIAIDRRKSSSNKNQPNLYRLLPLPSIDTPRQGTPKASLLPKSPYSQKVPGVLPKSAHEEYPRNNTQSSCSELAQAALSFPTRSGPAEWPLTLAKLAEYQKSFPQLDVIAELRIACQWCRDNAKKRKTFTGMAKFCTNWLARTQKQLNERGPASSNGRHARPKQRMPTDQEIAEWTP